LFLSGKKKNIPIVLLLLLLPGSSLAKQVVSTTPFTRLKAQSTKNLILMIGDGMQLEHEVAYSRYATGKDFCLVWDQFPYQGPVTTWDVTTYNLYVSQSEQKAFDPKAYDPFVGYNPDLGGEERFPIDSTGTEDYFFPKTPPQTNFATDSASAATAMATGVKTDEGNIAWLPGDPAGGALQTIAELFREKKHFAIGLVSTVPFNHATPAAFVSHNISRGNYHQIANEIITATKPDVVIGAGYGHSTYMNEANAQLLNTSDDYVVVKRVAGIDGGEALQSAAQRAIDAKKKLFGLFGGPDGHFESPLPVHRPGYPEVDPETNENPDLAEATTAALEVLAQNPNGLFLLVEQGDIDWANHGRDYSRMLGCVHDLHEAVISVIAFVNRPGDRINWDNTLLLVTSDHANGYMRNLRPLGKGELAGGAEIAKTYENVTTETKISYRSSNHTNELVSLYALGAGSWLFQQYAGAMHPGTQIVDNTDIYNIMKKTVLEGWEPSKLHGPYLFRNGTFYPSRFCAQP